MVYIYTLSTKEEPSKIKYVGKAKVLNRRLKRHLSDYYLNENTYKANWLKSELKKGNTPIIEIIDVVEECDWQFWEKYWIAQFKAWGFKLTNGTHGGEGLVLTQEILERRNETNIKKNRKRLQERIAKFNIREENGVWIANRKCECGRFIVYENKNRKIINNNICRAERENRKCNYCKVAGEKNHFFGKKLNDGKKKQKKYGQKILQLDLNGKFIKEFKSIREASEKTGIDRKSISNCAKGIKSYNTAGGYKFKIKQK
jgi:group I intron endonuclease